jgi:pimeloyl-ACP methyl ester carboxylesterase
MIDPVSAAFINATTEERLGLAENDEHTPALTALLGTQAYTEYRKLADRQSRHLSIDAAKNLIFVPGIMGSLLQSRTRGGIWWIDVRTRNRIDQLGLSADGTQDAQRDNDIVPTTTDYSYDPFLTAVLGESDFGHEIFAYDWRKSVRHSTSALRDTVLRLHQKNGGSPVHLVAHSMGGLVVRATLLQHGDQLWPKLGRIVFVATPHYGAPAIAGYLKNHFWGTELMALLGLYLSRETLRSLWGVVNLLAAPRGIYPGTRTDDTAPWKGRPSDTYLHPCANYDLYQVEPWQLGLSAAQSSQLQKILDDTADLYRQMYQAHRGLSQEFRDRMLVIAGVGYQTLFRLAYEPKFFGMWEKAEKLTARVPGDPHRDGDGRVPLASAMLEDVEIRYVKGVHGGLTNIPSVYLDVFRWLRNQPLQLPDTAKAANSTHLGGSAEESEAPHLDGTAAGDHYSDDPGLWNQNDPAPERLAALKAELEREALPEFTRVRLL